MKTENGLQTLTADNSMLHGSRLSRFRLHRAFHTTAVAALGGLVTSIVLILVLSQRTTVPFLQKGSSAPSLPLLAADAPKPDLRIADEPHFNRAAVSALAVHVENHGEVMGRGLLAVHVVDTTGHPLLPVGISPLSQLLTIPGYRHGGREGQTVSLTLTKDVVQLLDSLEHSPGRYGLRATIRTIGQDAYWADNTKIREWGPHQVLHPHSTYHLPYFFKNSTTGSLHVRWHADKVFMPAGAMLIDVPALNKPFVLSPGEEIRGTLTVRTGSAQERQSHFGIVFSLREDASDSVLHQREWFAFNDTIPPVLSNYRLLVLRNRTVAVQVLAGDAQSGVRPQGANTLVSTDGRRTWLSTPMKPLRTHGARLLTFESLVGPFPAHTRLMMRLVVPDNAGNVQAVIPIDASAFIAPLNAEHLFQDAAVNDDKGDNPLFGWERLNRIRLELGAARARTGLVTALDLPFEHRLESRRVEDLRALLASFDRLNIDLSDIKPIATSRFTTKPEGATDTPDIVSIMLP